MKFLGAIIAGGQARRFGSDKAAAQVDGRALLDHVADGLRGQVDALVVVGRDWRGMESIADRPGPDQGPLGGICAALHHAQENGFDAVLTAGCDTLPVPEDLLSRLLNSSPEPGGGPAQLVEGPSRSDGCTVAPSTTPLRVAVPLPVPGRNLKDQPLFALWPATLAPILDAWLATQPDRSMRGWIAHCGALEIATDTLFHNINRPADLLALTQKAQAA